jgi:hypothetical protein
MQPLLQPLSPIPIAMAFIITQSGPLMTLAVDNLPLTGLAMAGEVRADEEASLCAGCHM